MKKILFALIAFAGILSSCKNDDITISKAVTFKVNPATVVNNLYEYKAGDLTSIDSGDKLHVSLYIYDEKGILVKSASEDFSAYTHMMTTDIFLPAGSYTAIATSHVISDVNFWSFSGTDQLSTFKIQDEGYIGGKSKILGLTVKNLDISDKTETINVNIENAGAVAFVYFKSWNKYSNVAQYTLLGKQACDYLSFDNKGTRDYSIRSDDSYNYYKVLFNYNPNRTFTCNYFFTFPIQKASFCFGAITTNDKLVYLYNEFVDNVVIGESYFFLCDFDEEKAYWYDVTPNSTRANSGNEMLEKIKNTDNNRVLYNNDAKSISIR